MSRVHTNNLVGALSVATLDRVEDAFVGVVGRGGSFAAALLTVGTRPGLSVSELGRVLGLEHSSTVRLLDRLEGEGLIVRGSGVDRRARVVTLSPKGKRMFSKLSTLPVPEDKDKARKVLAFLEEQECNHQLELGIPHQEEMESWGSAGQ